MADVHADLLRDLFAHMAWADARVWREVLASGAVASDDLIVDTLFHLHLTQTVFLDVWEDREPGMRERADFASPSALRDWVRDYHARVADFLDGVTDRELARPVPVPWSKYFVAEGGGQAVTATLGETVLQVAAHSVHHRGQVNRRFREVGADPPLVDYIAWIWSGRPRPAWTADA